MQVFMKNARFLQNSYFRQAREIKTEVVPLSKSVSRSLQVELMYFYVNDYLT